MGIEEIRARESAAQTGLMWTEEMRRAVEVGIAAALGSVG